MKFINVEIRDVDKKNYLKDKYGGNAKKEYLDKNNLSSFSPAISWDAVSGAKSYALECIDYDSSPVAGFIFVHWVVANIKDNKLAENASRLDKKIIQGVNSATQGIFRSNLSSKEKEKSNLENSYYIGPRPPNSDHHYKFIVYALDVELKNLKKPFFVSDLHDNMRGHIIGMGICEVKYKQVK